MNLDRNILLCGVLLLAAGLAACASKPARLYTLSAGVPAPVGARASYAIGVDPVSVPRGVDIPQLLVRQADGSAQVAENRRWIAPLADEIRSAVSQQLQAQLGVQDLSGVAAAPGTRVMRVRLDVQQFESLADGRVQIVAAWSLRESGSEAAAASCVTRAQQPVEPGFDALVQGYRAALSVVATQIGAGLRALEAGAKTVACPVPAP